MKKIDSGHIPEALRLAGQEDLASPQPNEIIYGLIDIITPEAIRAGIGIEFGSNKFALQTALDALGVESALESKHIKVHNHQSTVVTEGNPNFIGAAMPELAKLTLVEALDAMQTLSWSSKGEDGPIKIHGENTTSRLLLLNSVLNDEGEVVGNISKPGIVVGVSYRYSPAFTEEEHVGPLSEYLDFFGKYGVVSAVARELREGPRDMLMPGPSYFLKIGTPVHTWRTFTHSDVAIYEGEIYALRDGQFLHISNDEDTYEI